MDKIPYRELDSRVSPVFLKDRINVMDGRISNI
jgi:hypothetical protein